jgi:hypothetical protein
VSRDIIKKPATNVSKWFAKETVGNFIYDQIGLLWRSAIMTAVVTGALRLFSGIPLDVWLIIALFIGALSVFILDRVARRRGWVTALSEGRSSNPLEAGASPETSASGGVSPIDIHAECEKKIERSRKSEEAHATRAKVHENELKTFRKEYFVPLAVADNQKAEIGKYLEVLRVCTLDLKLDAPMPTIKWAILFKNRSVHRISLDSEVGPLFFEGHKLTEHKDLLENKVMGLYPDREGSITFEQRLSAPEVKLIKSLPDGKFEFDKVMLYARRSSSDAEHVPPDRVVIFSRFRATLGRCSDERTQSTEPLEAEIENLKQQLQQTKKFDSEKAAERKALIASWRASVAKVYREYHDSGYSFTGLLATQDEYLSLLPNLLPETKTAIEDAAQGDYMDVRRLVAVLAEDIARIEQEWGL